MHYLQETGRILFRNSGGRIHIVLRLANPSPLRVNDLAKAAYHRRSRILVEKRYLPLESSGQHSVIRIQYGNETIPCVRQSQEYERRQRRG
jgi:hypothetical protein